MKVRTHITVEKDILDKGKEDATQMGLSMSSYVGMLIIDRKLLLKELLTCVMSPQK